MDKLEAARRMVQWAIEFSQFDIVYHPRTTIKAQALADFIAEFTLLDKDNLTDEIEQWTIQTDGSSAQKRGRVRVVKAQALADFIAKFTLLDEDSLTDEIKRWMIQTDGSSV